MAKFDIILNQLTYIMALICLKILRKYFLPLCNLTPATFWHNILPRQDLCSYSSRDKKLQNIRYTFHHIYLDETIIIENKNIKNISFFVNTPQLTETQTQYFCLNITQNTVVVLLPCLTRENFFKTFCNNIGLLFPFFSPTKYKREP